MTHTQVERLIARAKRELHLTNYRIFVEYRKKNNKNEDAAQCHSAYPYLHATVYIYPNFFEPIYNNKDRYHIIVHELVHILTEPFAHLLKEVFEGRLINWKQVTSTDEELTDRIAAIITRR